MMSLTILDELRIAGTAFLYGTVITIVYDVLRIFRRVISHGNFWIGIEDFFFWLWTTFWSFSLLYRENDGNLRMYTIAFMVMGMFVYHRTISAPMVEFIGKILKKLVSGIIMKAVYKCFVNPWRKRHGDKDES